MKIFMLLFVYCVCGLGFTHLTEVIRHRWQEEGVITLKDLTWVILIILFAIIATYSINRMTL